MACLMATKQAIKRVAYILYSLCTPQVVAIKQAIKQITYIAYVP